MYMPRFNADVQEPERKESNHEHCHHRRPVQRHPFRPKPENAAAKQQTAKEAIAANVQALIEQLEQGHTDGLTAYLTAMARFHNYSFGKHP
jgi:hypothetical protein